MAHDRFCGTLLLNTASDTVDPNVFNFDGTFNDNEGVYNGLNATIGDVIVLDTSSTEAGTVSRYSIQSFTNQTFSDIAGTMKYLDDPPAIDPSGSTGGIGIIGTPAPRTGMPWLSASDTQGYPIKLVEFCQNADNFLVEDPNLNTQTSDTFTLTSTDITNGYVELSEVPTPASSVILEIQGAPPQAYGVDYTIVNDGSGSPQRLSWNLLRLSGILSAGDKIIARYQIRA